MSAADGLSGQKLICVHCHYPNEVPEPTPTLLRNVSLSAVLGGLRCPHCDYRWEGLVENRCPECGRRFDPLDEPKKDARARVGGERFVYGMVAGGLVVFIILAVCAGLR